MFKTLRQWWPKTKDTEVMCLQYCKFVDSKWSKPQLKAKRRKGEFSKGLVERSFTCNSDQLQFYLSVSHQRYIIQYGNR